MLAVKIQESATELVGPSTDCCKLALGVIPRDLLDQSSGSSTRNYERQALVIHKLYAPHLRHFLHPGSPTNSTAPWPRPQTTYARLAPYCIIPTCNVPLGRDPWLRLDTGAVFQHNRPS